MVICTKEHVIDDTSRRKKKPNVRHQKLITEKSCQSSIPPVTLATLSHHIISPYRYQLLASTLQDASNWN